MIKGQQLSLAFIMAVVLVLLAITGLTSIALQPESEQINTRTPVIFTPIFSASILFTIPAVSISGPRATALSQPPVFEGNSLEEKLKQRTTVSKVKPSRTPLATSTARLQKKIPQPTQTLSSNIVAIPLQSLSSLSSSVPISAVGLQAQSALTDLSSALTADQLRISKEMSLYTRTLPAAPSLSQPGEIPATGRYIFVSQDTQTMHIYEDGAEIQTIPVSTGRPHSDAFTPAWRGQVGNYWGPQTFVGGSLKAEYVWYLFDGPEGSILIHSVPYRQEGDEKVYDKPESLGLSPVSNGCIRISPEDAAWLQAWNPGDVPIEITKLNQAIIQK